MGNKLRHWKQRFDKNVSFVWSRSILFGGSYTKVGEIIPDVLSKNPIKLKRFWESRVIELKDFKAPDVQTGQTEKDTPKIKQTKLDNEISTCN